MWKTVKRTWKLWINEFGGYTAIAAGIWIIGMIFAGILRIGGDFPGKFAFGTMMAALCGIFMCIFGFGASVFTGFDFALWFGSTRRDFLISAGIVNFLDSVLLLAVLKIFLELEMWISRTLFPSSWGIGGMEEVIKVLKPYGSVLWIPVYALLITGLSFAGGAFVHRFRTRGAQILVFIWLISFILISRLSQYPAFVEIFRSFIGLHMAVQILLGLVLGGVLYGAGLLGLRKDKAF